MKTEIIMGFIILLFTLSLVGLAIYFNISSTNNTIKDCIKMTKDYKFCYAVNK